MKTTINLADELYRDAKKAAVDRKVTLTHFLEQAIRHELAGGVTTKFELADCSFRGEPGLLPGVDLSDWARIRDLIYEGRGA